jgi:hypothetical protein
VEELNLQQLEPNNRAFSYNIPDEEQMAGEDEFRR